jgi:hypothetical protein
VKIMAKNKDKQKAKKQPKNPKQFTTADDGK